MQIRLMQRAKPEDGEGTPYRSLPFSGGERNRLFLNQGDNFKDLTLVSGLDFREDGRGFVIFDLDQDGFQDLAIASPNQPRLRIIRNRLGDLANEARKHSFVELKLVGGQTSKQPSSEWSSRDPFGATVLVATGEVKRRFQLTGGEGLASQNSSRIHIGLGAHEKIDVIQIDWPNGKQTVLNDVPAGKRLTVFENEQMANANAAISN